MKKQILIIDDEKNLCKLLKMNLESSREFTVTTAYTGEEGLELVKEKKFDLVITDFKLPGISGQEVVAGLKQAKTNVPVILFSIYHDDFVTIDRSFRKNIDGIITKPISNEELYQVINKALNIKQD